MHVIYNAVIKILLVSTKNTHSTSLLQSLFLQDDNVGDTSNDGNKEKEDQEDRAENKESEEEQDKEKTKWKYKHEEQDRDERGGPKGNQVIDTLLLISFFIALY